MILFGIVFVILAIFAFYKYRKKIALIGIALCIVGVGISYIRFDFKQEVYSGMIIDSHTNYFILLSKGEKLYAYSKENEYEIGDYVSIKGNKEELSFTKIESQFDFEEYLNNKGVYYSLNIKSVSVSFKNPIRIRNRREKFLSHFNNEQQSLIKALLFSEQDDSEDIANIKKLHLSRLASTSGLFIYAFLKFFTFILSYFIKDKRVKIVSLIILLPYVIFTIPRFTVLRIFLIEILLYINEAFLNTKFDKKQITGALGFFFLLIDYHLGYQMSFIMGFTLPTLISFIYNGLSHFKRLKLYVLSLMGTYFLLIPFELKFYNGINPLGIFLQTLFAPYFIFIAILSLLCFYGVPLYGVVGFFVKGESNLIGWLAKIAFQFNAPPLNEWFILIYILLFIIICYYRSIDFKPIYRVLTGILLSGIIIYHLPIENLITAEVCFINVGQGDSCLIRKGTTSILIDTGGLSYMDVANDSLIPFLKKKRIYNIDLVITTHNDYDHCGALDSLKENFYVKNVVQTSVNFPININGITLTNYNLHTTEFSDENDKSLVVGFHLMNKDFLIMGDAPIEVEKNIIKEFTHVDCDILKVGHHGSKTSTCDEFIKYLKPEVAIVSCGENNRYRHPHKEVIRVLNNNHVMIRRTDKEGTITYKKAIFL